MILEFFSHPMKHGTWPHLSLPTTNSSTATLLTHRIALDMSDFSGIAIASAKELPTHHDTTTQAYPGTQIDEVIHIARQPKVVFTQGCQVGFVLDIDGQME